MPQTHYYLNSVPVCASSVASIMSDFCDPWSVAHQDPLSMGFSRQEYWSGLPCPPPGDLPNPGMEPGSPAFLEDSLLLSHQGSPTKLCPYVRIIIFIYYLNIFTTYSFIQISASSSSTNSLDFSVSTYILIMYFHWQITPALIQKPACCNFFFLTWL